MPTTVTLDPDIAMALEQRRRQHDTTLSQAVNELLRLALGQAHSKAAPKRRFETRALPLGRPLIDNFDDIDQVLALSETGINSF